MSSKRRGKGEMTEYQYPYYPGVNVAWGTNNVNCGPLKEFPEISVDRFYREEDLKAEAFFLTHAHTDHMVGLEGPGFWSRMEEEGVTLYMGSLTGIMMTYPDFQRYRLQKERFTTLCRRGKVVPMDVLKPKVLELKSGRKVKVTALPAEHCPGSVMYLFESNGLRVLYTGDFRLTLKDWKNCRPLHDAEGKLLSLNHLYVDTTFCSMEYGGLFPDRIEIEDKIFSRLQYWLRQSEDRWVFITFAAKFAHEYFLYKLCKTLNVKVHITPEKLQIYEHIGPLANIFTLDGRSTPFHYCGNKQCRGGQRLFMKLSSMWFLNMSKKEDEDEDFSYPDPKVQKRQRIRMLRNAVLQDENVVRMDAKERNFQVCYAMHPSRQEVVEAIDYLKPMMVTPLVMPFSSELRDVREALKQNCKTAFLYEDYHSVSEFIEGKGIKKAEKLKGSSSYQEKLQQVLNSRLEDKTAKKVVQDPPMEVEIPSPIPKPEKVIRPFVPDWRPFECQLRRKRLRFIDSPCSSDTEDDGTEQASRNSSASATEAVSSSSNCVRKLVFEAKLETENVAESVNDINPPDTPTSKNPFDFDEPTAVPARASINVPEVIDLGSSSEDDTDCELEMVARSSM